jgi:hypothetical protein
MLATSKLGYCLKEELFSIDFSSEIIALTKTLVSRNSEHHLFEFMGSGCLLFVQFCINRAVF